MRFVAIDTETELFGPANMAPLLVCVSVCTEQGEPQLYDHLTGADLVDELFDDALASPKEDPLILTFQNGPYDLAVVARELSSRDPERGERFLRKCFELHDRYRIWDTRNVEWILDNADGVLHLMPWSKSKTGYRRPPKGSGWYGLGRLSRKYLFEEMDKSAGGVRTNFGYLRGTPLNEWPQEHVDYAKKDAKTTVLITREQFKRAMDDSRNVLADMPAQNQAYWALHLVSLWGLTTDLPMVAKYKAQLEHDMEEMRHGLSTIKMTINGEEKSLLWQVRGKRQPVKDEGQWKTSTTVLRALVKAAFEAQGLEVPMTEPSMKFPEGQVAADADTIEECDDPRLAPWKTYKHCEKMLETYVPRLEEGIVHPRYDLAATGRSTSYDPNIQNLPRKGLVRECHIPREGHYYCSVDYGSQEMVTFAQVMHWTIGPNALSDALNQDLDPHLMLASHRMGIDYDDALRRRKAGDALVKAQRQKSKGPNFGYPGGMGADKFVEYMRNQDPPEFYTVEEAAAEREIWFKTWNNDPRRYFNWVSTAVENGWIEQFVSKRVRGGGARGPGVGFSDGANTFFQGLAADMSKAALYEVVKRCYTDRKSALFGCRVVAFIHDELLVEVPIHRAHDCAMEIADIMMAAGKRYCPDVKSRADPALMERWYKGAEMVMNEAGILIPWRPKQEQVKEKAA